MRKPNTGMLARWARSPMPRTQFCPSPWPAAEKPVQPREGREGEGRYD